MIQHQTREDVLAYEVIPALGEHVSTVDVDAVIDECWRYQAGRGFVQDGDDEAFWKAVEKHAR